MAASERLLADIAADFGVSEDELLAASLLEYLKSKKWFVWRTDLRFCQDITYPLQKNGSSLFCMGNSRSPLSAGADYMRGVMNDERP